MNICKELLRIEKTQNKIKPQISDEHLENSLRITITSQEPDMDALVSPNQSQNSQQCFVYVALFLKKCYNENIFFKRKFCYLYMYNQITFSI